jgi:hypothetical protein
MDGGYRFNPRVVFYMASKCPVCGTPGASWNKTPQAFKCPNCFSIFSEFGMILEAENEAMNLWA